MLNYQLYLFIIVSALVVSIVMPASIAWLWNKARALHYRKFEPYKDPRLEGLISLLTRAQELTFQTSSLTPETQIDHQVANNLQSRYHFVLAYAVSALMIGFIGLTFAVTLGRESHSFVMFSAFLDVFCFLLVAASFFICVRINRQWVASRIIAEFGRQRDTLRQLWARSVKTIAPPPRSVSESERFQKAIREAVEFIPVIRAEWKSDRERLADSIEPSSLCSDSIARYLRQRVIRQANWYYASRHRIYRQGVIKELMLKLFFGVVLLLSVLKSLIITTDDLAVIHKWKYFLYFFIFLFLSLSTWLTALFVGQNSKSLMHRYDEQSQRIHAWLNTHVSDLDAPIVLLEAMPTLSVEAVLEFEDLIIDELISWVAITERDMIELSPA